MDTYAGSTTNIEVPDVKKQVVDEWVFIYYAHSSKKQEN